MQQCGSWADSAHSVTRVCLSPRWCLGIKKLKMLFSVPATFTFYFPLYCAHHVVFVFPSQCNSGSSPLILVLRPLGINLISLPVLCFQNNSNKSQVWPFSFMLGICIFHPPLVWLCDTELHCVIHIQIYSNQPPHICMWNWRPEWGFIARSSACWSEVKPSPRRRLVKLWCNAANLWETVENPHGTR